MSTFTGFSEDDLKRMKLSKAPDNGPLVNASHVKRIGKFGVRPKKELSSYKLPILKQESDDGLDNTVFDKCKLSLKSPTSSVKDISADVDQNVLQEVDTERIEGDVTLDNDVKVDVGSNVDIDSKLDIDNKIDNRKSSTVEAPDVVKCTDYNEDDLATHRVKIEELQLKQKIMEEQNKKRKEMLAKALADRTRQTEEEVLRLEKIKKELQVLDGQFSQDVAVLRKKIDQACLTYSEAEKHYLKVEKEFLQAKINLQKEKERKELLTEHLCALITHNETRKAQKLETLMVELASDKMRTSGRDTPDDSPVIIDGVDERTGKMVEMFTDS